MTAVGATCSSATTGSSERASSASAATRYRPSATASSRPVTARRAASGAEPGDEGALRGHGLVGRRIVDQAHEIEDGRVVTARLHGQRPLRRRGQHHIGLEPFRAEHIAIEATSVLAFLDRNSRGVSFLLALLFSAEAKGNK